MYKAVTFSLKVAGFIIAILVGAAIGLKLSLTAFNMWQSQYVAAWKPLPLPDLQQPDHFVVTESLHVYVQSTSGDLLMQRAGTTTWEPPTELEENTALYGGCDLERVSTASAWEGRPPGTIKQALVCAYGVSAETGFTVRYLILENDSHVWRQHMEMQHGLGLVAAMLGFPLLGLGAGALVGALLYGILLILCRWLRRKQQ